MHRSILISGESADMDAGHSDFQENEIAGFVLKSAGTNEYSMQTLCDNAYFRVFLASA